MKTTCGKRKKKHNKIRTQKIYNYIISVSWPCCEMAPLNLFPKLKKLIRADFCNSLSRKNKELSSWDVFVSRIEETQHPFPHQKEAWGIRCSIMPTHTHAQWREGVSAFVATIFFTFFATNEQNWTLTLGT